MPSYTTVAFLGLGPTNQMLIWHYFSSYILLILRLLKSVFIAWPQREYLLVKKKNYGNWTWLGILITSLPYGTNPHYPKHLANTHLVLHPDAVNAVTVFGTILRVQASNLTT